MNIKLLLNENDIKLVFNRLFLLVSTVSLADRIKDDVESMVNIIFVMHLWDLKR